MFICQYIWISIICTNIDVCKITSNHECSSLIDVLSFQSKIAEMQEKWSDRIKYWKDLRHKEYIANENLIKDYENRMNAFYRGEIAHLPGPRGPVGISRALEEALAFDFITYFDKNFNQNLEFKMWHNGKFNKPFFN